MFVVTKKIISYIGVLGIVAGGFPFNSLAVGPLNSDKTELGESDLVVGCSGLRNPKYASELTDEENDKLVEETKIINSILDKEKNKSENLRMSFKHSEQKLDKILFRIKKLEELLGISYKNLIKAKVEFKGCKVKNNKKYMDKYKLLNEEQNKEQKSFDDKCEEFKNQLQLADDMLSQVKGIFYQYVSQENIAKKDYEKYLEMKAKYYNLNTHKEYNELFNKYFAILKQEMLSSMDFCKCKRTMDEYYIKTQREWLELLEKSSLQVDWEKEGFSKLTNVDILDVLKELSKSQDKSAPWMQTLNQYMTLRDQIAEIESIKLLKNYNVEAISGKLNQITEKFHEKKKELKDRIISKYEAEHAKPKIEIGASTSKISDNQKEVNISEKDIVSTNVQESSKEIDQVKIDKSSEYNKEKKLRLKEEKKKNRKNAKRGVFGGKNSGDKKVNLLAESNVLVKAKIVKPKEDEIQKDVNVINNDGESTLSDSSEEFSGSTQSDSINLESNSDKINTSVELSSIDSEEDSESTDNINNLEMSYEEIREKLVEIIKLRGPQSDDEFIEYLYDEFMKYPLSKTEN